MKKNLLVTLLFLLAATSFAQSRKQTIVTPLPDEYTFKVGSDENLGNMHVIQSIPQDEQPDKWTLLLNNTVIKHISDLTPTGIIEMYKKSTREEASNARFTVIESKPKVKDKSVYVIFKVEIPRFHYDPQPQSRLYYIVQGDSELFVNYVAVKSPTLDKAFENKWVKVFKASKLEYK
ncbi:hypothetical protein Q765_11105 [Flavobacterium rivuli WB 3.3-2 = DSM 21788]|uniref:PsbP C-terminal domain-containing protein n=1 Tax=Flavobacterium rivuli WB 3.3-2 = DSM 21788 TaxID=1121895 RepID=A0A0A2MDP0_9FLAO|nr:hypothetical protein [Flavobacterium rivuli]KGO86420.1 hypothetical protein Q765_11105 [Flavobacterium rivuli WB 3.3-2 = DSM 21788]